MYKRVDVVLDKKMRALCVKSYPGHPEGCPQFDKKQGCPPSAKFFEDVYDLNQPVYAIWNIFDMESHVKRLKEKHPLWSERQLKCCLYWQPGARKKLTEEITSFLKEFPDYHVTRCPEAMGVNVTYTMRKLGIELEWPPEINAYQIAMGGIEKNRKNFKLF